MEEDQSSGYYLYYRKAKALNRNPRDHFVKDGEALCNYGVKPPEPEAMKALESISPEEWSLH